MSDLTPEDEALLGRARVGLDPTDVDRERVKSKLFAQIGIGTLAATKSTAAATTLFAGASTKVIAGVGIAVLMIGGSIAIHRATSHERSSSTPAMAIAPPQVPSAASSSLAPIAPLTATTPAPSSAPSPDAVSSVVMPAPTPNPRASSRNDLSSAAATRASDPVAASTVSTSLTTPSSTQSPAAIANAPSTVTAPAATGSTLEAEIALLQSAHDSLKKGDADRALILLDRHRAQFPNGALAEERDVERVVALCDLGRASEAHELAQSFLAAHPNSSHAERVRASCGGAP